jgi:cysteine-rich repeat protein
MKISSLWPVCAACLLAAACGEERQLPEHPDAPPESHVDARVRPVIDAPVATADAAPGVDGPAHVDARVSPDARPGTPDAVPGIDATPGTPDAPPPPPIDAPPPPGPDGGPITSCGDHVTQPPEQCDDGNAISGDGCEPDCTLSVAEDVHCETLAPLPQGVCAVTTGGDVKLFKGDVLTPGRIFRGGQVAVDATGHIACVGCDCAASAAGATVITCPRGASLPGSSTPTITSPSPRTRPIPTPASATSSVTTGDRGSAATPGSTPPAMPAATRSAGASCASSSPGRPRWSDPAARWGSCATSTPPPPRRGWASPRWTSRPSRSTTAPTSSATATVTTAPAPTPRPPLPATTPTSRTSPRGSTRWRGTSSSASAPRGST